MRSLERARDIHRIDFEHLREQDAVQDSAALATFSMAQEGPIHARHRSRRSAAADHVFRAMGN